MRVWRSVLGTVFLLAAATLLVWSVARRWDELRTALTHLDPWAVVLSSVLAFAGLAAQMSSWRALFGTRDVPSRAASARVYFVGQLGKYIPGGAWSLLAQTELARRYHVPRTRSAILALSSLVVLVVTGAVVAGAGLVAWSPTSLGRYWWVLAVVPIGVVALLPPVFGRAIGLLQRLMRRTDSPAVSLDSRSLARSVGWACVMWVLFGLHAALLVVDLGVPDWRRALPLAIGAFALAWVVGFLVVVAPAGTGPREAALVLALAPVLGSSDALLVALVSRIVMVLADGVWAAVAVGVARIRDEPAVTAGTGSP